MKGYIKPSLAFAILLVIAADGLADSRSISNQDDNPFASARIKLRVVIPKVLLFRNADTTPSLKILAFPTSVTTSTGNGRLVLHGNSGPASIVNENGAAAETTYTAASL